MELILQCRELEQQMKIELQYVGIHAGELLWDQLNSLLFPGVILETGNVEKKGITLANGFRFFWRIIRPMTYYWLGDLGWHLFKLWFKRLFRKKNKHSSD